MSYDYDELTFPLLGGQDSLHNPADIPQGRGDEDWGKSPVLRMAQAKNVYAANDKYDLLTRPGFADVRGTAINAAGVFTCFRDQNPIANQLLMTVSIAAGSHKIYIDDANPPSAIAGGTDFTIGADNLINAVNFTDGTNPMSIFASRQRDTMQSVNGSGTRADFTTTGTIKAKARMAVLMRRNEIQATHDAADARIAASKASMMTFIGELNVLAIEINGA